MKPSIIEVFNERNFMTSNEQLIEFFREFILSVIDHGDLDLFLETMSEEVNALIPPDGETIH